MDIKESRLYKMLVPISQMIGAGILIGGVVSGVLAASSSYLYDNAVDRLKTEFVSHDELELLRREILRANKEDGVVKMREGWSYVIEPVYNGDTSVYVNLILERTERGKNCTFIEGASIFEDENAVRAPGSRLQPIEQIKQGPKRFRLHITPPKMELADGRIGIDISMKYQCPRLVDGKLQTLIEYDTVGTLFYYQRSKDE